MQEGYRNPKDGFRSGFHNGGGGGGGEKSDLPPHPRRKEILMEAGRLAAEYLVSKGLLPRESLSPKLGSNRKLREFRGRAWDSSPVDCRRTSDGGSGRRTYCCRTSDGGNGRRRYCDGEEYSRNRFQGWKRNDGSYNNREYSLDGGRDSGRWRGRDRSNDRIEDEDDNARDYRRDQRVRFNRRPLRSEFVGELGSENPDNTEDRSPRRRSASTWKEPPMESDVYLSKAGDGGRMVRSETRDELKCDTSGDLNKRNVVEEESDIVQTCVVEGDGKCDGDLTKLCGFSEVPTRPLSSVLQTNQKIDDQEIVMEASYTAEFACDVMKIAAGVEKQKEGSSSYSPSNQSNTLKTQVNDTSSIIPTQSGEESVNKGQERSQTPAVVTEEEEASQREGVKRQREPSPEDKYSRQDNLRARQSSPEEEGLQMDVEKVTPVAAEQEKPVEDTCFPEVDPVLDVKLEEEKPLLPISYKICDLNLMGTPEIIEIPDDPVLDHVYLPAPGPVTGKEISMDRGLSIGVHNNGTDDCSQLPNDDKVVQVIDLENGAHMEADCCDTSRPKDGTMTYQNLDNFLSHAEHEDLPIIRDGYFIALSEFLGTGISRCPSVPSNLKNSAGRNGPS